MVKMPSQTEIDASYKEAIPRVAGKYKKGVQGTTDWKEKAIAGEGLYAAKVQEAIANQSRAKGINKISPEEWKNAAASTGAERIGGGMTANAAKRTRNFEPYRQALEGLTLPERTADPMTNVTQRVGGIVQKMVDTKKSIG